MGDCQTGFSLGLCIIAIEADDSAAIDSVELHSDDDSTEESIQKETNIMCIKLNRTTCLLA